MGLPAMKYEPQYDEPVRQHRTTKAAPRRSPSSRPSRQDAHAHRTLVTFMAVVVVVTVLGLGRVWLSVSAAEASLDAHRLRGEIKEELYRGQMLAVRYSMLGSPTRVRSIACASIGMVPADKATYVDVSDDALAMADSAVQPARDAVEPSASGPAAEKSAAHSAKKSPAASVIARVMGFTADEAHVLLVGDVGLASAR